MHVYKGKLVMLSSGLALTSWGHLLAICVIEAIQVMRKAGIRVLWKLMCEKSREDLESLFNIFGECQKSLREFLSPTCISRAYLLSCLAV